MSTNIPLKPKHPKLVMRIQPKIIEHLGINMYTSLNPVISELIANSWDAEAHNVYVTIPTGPLKENAEIVVRDDGNGMEYHEIINKYLQVGRNRRYRKDEPESFTELSPNLKRGILGRKGVGKLSVFGVAKNVIVKTVRNKRITEFEMDVEKIKKQESSEYYPTVIQLDNETNEADGTTVILKELTRKREISPEIMKKGLARRFSLLDNDFKVHINGDPIKPEDREITDIEYRWPIDEALPNHPEWKVSGEIFTRKATIPDEEMRGIAIFAGKKLVQEPTFFTAGSAGKTFAYSHMMGELNAEFLDGKNDVIATYRTAINWESEEGQALKNWGYDKIKLISNQWSKWRKEKKLGMLKDDKEIRDWFEGLSTTERKRADRVFLAILGNDELPDERAMNLAMFVKDSFHYTAFQELADQIEEANPENALLIIKLFQEWEHLEAKEMYRIMEGRIATIEKLKWYIENNAQEVPTIHNYLKSFPWIMDPRWTIIQDEVRYSDLLRQKFSDNEKDRRIDFLCFGSWPNAIVVELKRPGWKIGQKELEQIREYVIFIESLIGTDPEFSFKKVYGYLICEDVQKSETNAKRITKLEENGIFVRKYSELLSVAEQIHQDMITRYTELAKITKAKED